LLCLCDSDEIDRFYSGGVDGRIHAWSCNVNVKKPLYSIGAHKGRVNVMIYSYATSLLFSAGHDGTIQCRGVPTRKTLNKIPDAQFTLFDADGNAMRVTALAILQDSSNHAHLVAGTATGELAFFETGVKDDTAAIIPLDVRYRFPEEPVINAICVLKPTEKPGSTLSLTVGHSLGLTLMTIEYQS
jgi:WD40 repeat protein